MDLKHSCVLAKPRRASQMLWALVFATVALAAVFTTSAAAAPGEVVILDSTVSGGAGSTLASKFTLAGKTPVIKNGTEWAAMSASDFDAYDAVVLGDPTCSNTPPAAAAANAATWSSVVDGNVVVIGTDETYHQGQGGDQLMEKAAAFTVAKAGKTGAYVSLSCYYHGADPLTPVPMLSGFGTFTVTGVGCYNDSHIVATHPALTGLTDGTLSNWSCSVHEAFDSFPLSFEVLAIAENIGDTFTAPDGTTGTPYILARGVEVISDIKLTPPEATNVIGSPHTVTATVVRQPEISADEPAVGVTVTFKVIDGPNTGVTGTAVTDSSGVATFTYTSSVTGVDTIEATFMDQHERTQRSNRVTKTWVNPPPVEPAPVSALSTPTVGLAAYARCSSRALRVRPQYSGGTPDSASLYVDSKLVKKVLSSKPTFVINTKRYKSGTHRLRVDVSYPTGQKATTRGSFQKCRARTAQRKVSPQFTG
ncbi:MAG: hypothetical protein HY827_10435 [Actinobacteria bacterium]|nr:hypothetical protein [Actinomycetota bacterium]